MLRQDANAIAKRPIMNASFPDLSSEHRSKAVPPIPNRLVADVDSTFMKQILDLPQ
jgi:hypothetical protein